MIRFISGIVSLFFISTHILASELNWETRIFIDAAQFGPYYQKDATESSTNKQTLELNSLKSTLKYHFNDDIKSKLQFEITKPYRDNHKNQFEFKDVFIEWDISQSLSLITGRSKAPFSHEALMGSSSLPTMERSMATSAFSPGRNVGAQLTYSPPSFTFSSGLFKIEDDDIKDGYVISSRATLGLSRAGSLDHLHIGAGISYRGLNKSLFQIKERGEINSADNIIRSARFYADQQITSNFEFGSSYENYWLMSEFFYSHINQFQGENWHYQGFYIQLSSTINLRSNPTSQYSYKNGEFKTPKHKTHDIEWVIRYSGLLLRDNNIGSEASSFLLGLNYYLNKNTRLMINYLTPNISGNVVNTNQSGNGINVRFSYEF